MTNQKVKEETSFDIADSFVSYSNEITVADFIISLQAEDVYRNMNVKTAGNLAEMLTYDDSKKGGWNKTAEENTAYIIDLIAKEIEKFSDEDFEKFAISYYDKDFSLENGKNEIMSEQSA